MPKFERTKLEEMTDRCEKVIKEILIEDLCHCHLMLHNCCDPEDLEGKAYWRGARDTVKSLLMKV